MPAVEELAVQTRTVAFKHILVATDLSPISANALRYATLIARRYHSALTVAHVIPREPRSSVPLDPLPRDMDTTRLSAEQAVEKIDHELSAQRIPHHMLLERGSVREIILAEIKRSDIDLLIIGTHGRGGFKKLALGSFAEELLRLAPCPVLTVGPHVRPPDTDRLQSILFATDFGPASTRAVPLALSLAEENAARLCFLNLISPMPIADVSLAAYAPPTYAADDMTEWQVREQERARRKLVSLIPADAKLAHVPEYLVSADFTAEGILEAAQTHCVDLIIMGANHAASARVAAHIPWAITHKVLSSAQCPVLTVAE